MSICEIDSLLRALQGICCGTITLEINADLFAGKVRYAADNDKA